MTCMSQNVFVVGAAAAASYVILLANSTYHYVSSYVNYIRKYGVAALLQNYAAVSDSVLLLIITFQQPINLDMDLARRATRFETKTPPISVAIDL